MKELLTDFKQALAQYMTLAFDDDYIGEPGPPATAEALEATGKLLGHALPPSYAQALAVHGGWKEFMGEAHLVSIEQRTAPEFDRALKWSAACLEDADLPNIFERAFVVVHGGPDTVVYLDLDKPTEGGEFEVVNYSMHDGELSRHRSFRAFIESELTKTRRRIQDQQGDAE